MGTEDKRLQFQDLKVPGPGSYKFKETNERKTYSFPKSGFIEKKKQSGPGPGSYEAKNSIGELPSYNKS